MSHNNQDNTIKNIGVICLSVIVFALIYNALLGGNGFNAHMAYGRTSGYGLTGSLSVILALVIKLLIVGIVVAGIVGIVAVIKSQGLDKTGLSFIEELFDNEHHRRHFCPHCHRETEIAWKHCPYCGSSAAIPGENNDKQVENQQTNAVDQSANDISTSKTGNSKKNKS